VKKPKPLSPSNLQLFKDQVEYYETLDNKARDGFITYHEVKEREGARKWIEISLWDDRHVILAALEAYSKK